MDSSQALMISFALNGVMFGLLVGLIGWIGSRMFSKLDDVSKALNTVAGELHARINGLDHRVTRCEVFFQTNLERDGK